MTEAFTHLTAAEQAIHQRLMSLRVQFEQSRDACYDRAVGKGDYVRREDVARAEVWDLAARCVENARVEIMARAALADAGGR